MNVYIIGMRAVGKSTVGQRLAERLSRPFLDMDRELMLGFRQSISEFVRAHGWSEFRARERGLLKRVAELEGVVVATGGGVIGDDRNISCMRTGGWVVWLKADAETLSTRLNQDRRSTDTRPPIGESEDAAVELKSLLRQRQQSYQKAMHIAVDTKGRSPETICRVIIDQSGPILADFQKEV